MSRAESGARRGQNSRKSLVRRITAHQIGEQISLLLFFDVAVLAAIAFFIAARLCAASVMLAPSAVAGGAGATYVTDTAGAAGGAGAALGAGAAVASSEAAGSDGGSGGAQPPNVLFDGYALGSGVAEPGGLRVRKPFTALFELPEGAYVDMSFLAHSDMNLFRQWAAVQSFFYLPDGAGLYNSVQFTHDTLFFILFRALAVLLAVQAFVIVRGAFHTRRHTRQTLRPITELTLAAQSINAAQKQQPIERGVVAGGGRGVAAGGNHGSPADNWRGGSPDSWRGGPADSWRGAPAAGERGAAPGAARTAYAPQTDRAERAVRNEPALKLSGAIDTINTITERHLDKRISIEDERVELKGLASAINGMLDRLDAAYQAQLRFVSDASHELRTPISVIQGYANLLDRWGKNDERTLQESIDAIKNEAESMKELVEQLLFLTRGENQSIMLHMEDVDVAVLIDEVTREAIMIDEAHEYQSKTGEGLYIRGDYQLLKQALRILVDNSVKFTPPGGRIAISSAKSGSRPGYLDIIVRDSGAGISEDALPHIFDRFFKADESRARSTGGTGLGLAIAKWIIDSHQGVIEVVSRKDAGTRFTLSFLAGDPPETAIGDADSPEASVKVPAAASSASPTAASSI
ncbi:MAG: HAMP domain-containing histidine kinase [Oscillospiraceae bacterium]|nr:HAMP domain-containing histidine kinase [Oscillospiraceae bacterium]